MSAPLQRLYKTKFTLLAVASCFVGAGLMVAAQWAATNDAGIALRAWPVGDIGLGLFTTGLFGVLFQYVGQRDAEEDNLQRIRSVIVDDFAGSPNGLAALVSSETRDGIIRNCLGLQLGDRVLADDLYDNLREQLMRIGERRYDLATSVALAPWRDGPSSGRGSMFVATIHREYRFTPTQAVARFICVSDLNEYRDLAQDSTAAVLHYFEPIGNLDGASTEAFQLLDLTVGGRPISARRSVRKGSQVFAANLGIDPSTAGEVTIAYTYRVLVQRHGHLLHLDISRPTRGVKFEFNYGGCAIRYVSVLDYLGGNKQPRLSQLPASDPTPSIQLAYNGWVMPKAGIGFVWVLEEELSQPRPGQ